MQASPAKVLIVDDHPGFVENLQEILSEAGYLVQSAPSCELARRHAESGFDIALVDMRLPDGLGTELAGQLRQQNPDAAVVLLTGYSTVEAAAAAVRAGAFAYLSKPCATPELLLTLEQAQRQVGLQAEKRELARRAKVAEKLAAVGTMTAGLSHEIRNPLNAAGLQLSVLERRIDKLSADLQPALLEPLRLVRDEIRRLDHLLEDFLQFAKPRELKGEVLELESVVTKVHDLLARDAERREVTWVRNLSSDLKVRADEGRLRQVVMNLALNALEATPSKGQVTLTLKRAGANALLWVDDTGKGVGPELRERIFEPFFTTKAQGSGLGLPIVHAIVTQHSGTLTVTDAPGGGARFVVSLPLVDATPAH